MTTATRGEITTSDGITLSTATWLPNGSPKALALICHGHAEHLGRYQPIIDALLAQGYVVAGQDHRGHGRSSGERALAMRFDDFVDDFRLLARHVQVQHPDLPVVLVGHSMGGLIAARYALRFQSELRAVVLSGAAFIIDEGVSAPARWTMHQIARLFPKAPVPRPDDSDTLSTDPAIKEAFAANPLNYHGKTRMRTASQMVKAGADALDRAPLLTIPLLAMHGEADTLTSPNGTRRFYEAAGSTDKMLKLWPGMKHEIFNEVSGPEVIAYTLGWLGSRSGVTGS